MRIFGPGANSWAKSSIVALVLLAGAAYYTADSLQRSSYTTKVNETISQPVPFTHQHHVSGLGIDCRYCHTSVEKSSFAGIPPTSTCMNCHSQIWSDSPMLAPVRESAKTGVAIPWVRVHQLPGFVKFNHSAHVNKGVGCTTCHGPIDKMPITWKANTLYMGWCLECHRHPENFVRPKSEVFNVAWKPSPHQQEEIGMTLVEKHNIRSFTNCSTCHY